MPTGPPDSPVNRVPRRRARLSGLRPCRPANTDKDLYLVRSKEVQVRRCEASLYALGLSILLFGLYSIARERLVPFNADYNRAAWRLTGDEPAYLLTAQAIASGDGENVRNVHENRTYTNFQSRAVIGDNQWTWQNYRGLGVSPLIDRAQSWGDKQVIQRPPLIALFSAPFVLQRSHVRWSIAFAQGIVISVLAALLLVTAGFADRSRLGRGASSCLAFLGGMPVVYYTAQIFPEVLMGAFLALSLLLTRKECARCRWIGYALMCASLWGSARLVVGVAAASLIYLWRDVRDREFLGVGILLLGWLSYVGYNLWLWGHLVPPNPHQSSQLTIAFMPKGFLMNLFGNDVGLLFLSPVAWVGLVCLILTAYYHQEDRGTLPSVLLLLGIILVVSAFPEHRAGTCPAGRFQVVQSFVLLVPLLVFIGRESPGSRWTSRINTTLVVWGTATLLMGIQVAQDPRSWFERDHPLSRMGIIQPHYHLLPNFQGRWLGHLVVWLLVFIGSTFLYDVLRLCGFGKLCAMMRCWARRDGPTPER